jgi:hypothetical protein
MIAHPSRWPESLAAALVPPASREHVLGDLSECCRSPGQYLSTLASVLPGVILRQIRRRVSWGDGIGLMALLSGLALLVTMGVSGAPFFEESGAWGRLAVPWVVLICGCVLSAAYGPADQPRLWSGSGVALTILATIVTAALVGLPVVPVSIAVFVAVALHMAIAVPLLGTELRTKAVPPLTIDALPDQARRFQRTIRWRNARESVAAVVVLAMLGPPWRLGSGLDGLSHVLLYLGVLCMMYVLHFRAGSRKVPGGADPGSLLKFHQSELARQRDMLRRMPQWGLLPFVPGIVVSIVARWEPLVDAPTLVVVAVVFYVIWRLNRWAAQWLDERLAEAGALAERLQ